MTLNLNGDGMCVACINGDHQEPRKAGTPTIAHRKQGQLCNCPCHLSKAALGTKKKPAGAPAEQTTINAPSLFIGAKE